MHQSEGIYPWRLLFVDRFVVFYNHHPVMITDFNCAFQTSAGLKDASIWRNLSLKTALRWQVCCLL
jgi:hypothetical protein